MMLSSKFNVPRIRETERERERETKKPSFNFERLNK